MRRLRIFDEYLLVSIMMTSVLLVHSHASMAAEPTVDERLQQLERQLEQLRQQTQRVKPIDVMTVNERLEKLERKQPLA